MFGSVKQIVRVEGMHCLHCADKVEKSLSAVEGVKSAKVNLEKKIAVVKTKTPITEEAAKKAIEEAGFQFAGLE